MTGSFYDKDGDIFSPSPHPGIRLFRKSARNHMKDSAHNCQHSSRKHHHTKAVTVLGSAGVRVTGCCVPLDEDYHKMKVMNLSYFTQAS